MITYMLLFALMVFNIPEPLPYPSVHETGSVKLVVEGIDVRKGGSIAAGIFTEEFFPEAGKATFDRFVSVDASVMEIYFDEIPVGEYAAAVFQDVDNNGELRTNFLGVPREPVGFSMDARIRMGPPSYRDAAFEVQAGETITLTIILR